MGLPKINFRFLIYTPKNIYFKKNIVLNEKKLPFILYLLNKILFFWLFCTLSRNAWIFRYSVDRGGSDEVTNRG